VSRAAVRSRGVHREGGQATVEWVALVLVGALVLGAAAALSGRESDRGLGEAVARRIAGAPAALDPGAGEAVALDPARSGTVAPPPRHAHGPTPAAPAPPASTPRAVDAFRRLRGVADVAKHTWIVCLGYRRWLYELENPSAPTESLPLGEALDIVSTCINPYDFLRED
jgi:hypothetical protein